MMTLYMIGGNTKPIVAIELLLKSKELTGKELLRKIFGPKQPVRFYLLVFVTAIISYIIPIFIGTSTIIAPLYIAVLSLPIMIVGGGLKEIGWRLIFNRTLKKR